ncbi:hypothetical protein B0H13DRAFT_2524049 [Mycena leptocephala]|nr:hypothetical protein B0H13DRAFT_2524049 [Mycena leptocephala]
MTEYQPSPLDDTLYKEEDFAFIKEESGMRDSDAFKKHIIAIQSRAYSLHSFPCIRTFQFAKTQMSTFPAYQQVLKVGREREGAILLDLGCCCGTDIRKVARDGFPTQNLIASDILPDFWNIGHELFKSTPESIPVVFLAGDALDANFLEPVAPVPASSEVTDSPPPLTSLTCLTPLCGHVSVIHISFVFHLFPEDEQLRLAQALGGLLSPLPGSVILGCHVAQRWKGLGPRLRVSSVGHRMFCHSPESWREMWEAVFPKGTIKVETDLKRRATDGPDGGILTWSVTRI